MPFQPFIAMKNFFNSKATVSVLLGLATLVTINGFAGASRNEAMVQTAQPGASRIAVIDVQKVLTTSTIGKTAYEKLRKMQEDRMQKARLLDDEARKLDAQIAAGKATLNAAQLSDLQKQLADKRIAIQRYAKDAEREIGEARDRELQALETRVKPVMDTIGKELGLQAIFNKFESGLIYASDSIDVTDVVIKRLNETVPVK
jgi:outer membrane protein